MALRDRGRFGFAVPQVFVEGGVAVDELRDVAVAADAARLDSLWMQSQLVGRAAVLEPVTTLAHVAAITAHVRLGTSVLVAGEHNPVQLAKQLATLDHLCGGRLTVGLGMGAPGLTASVGGMDMDRPVRRLVETVEVMRALWACGEATFRGRLWQLDGVAMNPKPLQRPHPPVWLGGHHPDALRRAVRLGAGWMSPGASTLDDLRRDLARLSSALEEAGRARSTFTVAKRVYVAVDDDRERALARLRQRFAAYSGDPDRAVAVSLAGTPARVAEGLEQVIDAGVELVVLNPVYDFREQQERLLGLIGR